MGFSINTAIYPSKVRDIFCELNNGNDEDPDSHLSVFELLEKKKAEGSMCNSKGIEREDPNDYDNLYTKLKKETDKEQGATLITIDEAIKIIKDDFWNSTHGDDNKPGYEKGYVDGIKGAIKALKHAKIGR